MHHSC